MVLVLYLIVLSREKYFLCFDRYYVDGIVCCYCYSDWWHIVV